MSDVEAFKKYLKQEGVNITKTRQLIFESLINKEPLQIKELTKLLDKKVDRASIYRTLDLFLRLGITKRNNIGWKYTIELSDKFSEHHHHIICINCGRILIINDPAIEKLVKNISKNTQFSLIDHQLEIQGKCSKC